MFKCLYFKLIYNGERRFSTKTVLVFQLHLQFVWTTCRIEVKALAWYPTTPEANGSSYDVTKPFLCCSEVQFVLYLLCVCCEHLSQMCASRLGASCVNCSFFQHSMQWAFEFEYCYYSIDPMSYFCYTTTSALSPSGLFQLCECWWTPPAVPSFPEVNIDRNLQKSWVLSSHPYNLQNFVKAGWSRHETLNIHALIQ